MLSQSLQMDAIIPWGRAAWEAITEKRFISFIPHCVAEAVDTYRATRLDGSSFFFEHSRVFNHALGFAIRTAEHQKRPLACVTNTNTGESHIL